MSEEEMIKIIKEITITDLLNCWDGGVKEYKAIKSLLDSYTNLKQIEQEHKKINGELREEIKQLKDEFYKEECLNKLEKPQCKHMSDKPYLKV
jgi:hypothetical protein